MASSIEYVLKLSTNGKTVLNDLSVGTERFATRLSGVARTFQMTMAILRDNAIVESLERADDKIKGMAESGIKLDTALTELKAMTGVTDTALKSIADSARKASKEFGTEAYQNVDAYTLILSKLSPEIAKNVPALVEMGRNVSYLSKQMGGDSVASASLLTTAMNQYGVDLSDPMRATQEMTNMMNIMSKAAQDGSAQLPEIGSALEKAGAMAVLAKVKFSEVNSAIQLLDKAGKKGAEGGTAISNALSILGKGRFMPAETLKALQKAGVDVKQLSNNALTLGQRFKLLQPIMNDQALLSQMFGAEGIVAGKTLTFQADELDRMAKAFEGTNSAVSQAEILMSSYAEKQARSEQKIKDFQISLFNATSEFLPFINYATQAGSAIGETALYYNAFETLLKSDSIVNATKWIGLQMTALRGLSIWTTLATYATNLFSVAWWSANFAMLAIPIAIGAIIGAIGYVIYKVDGWGEAWDNVVEGFKDGGKMIVTAVRLYGKMFVETWLWAFDQIKLAWYKTKELFGSKTASAEISAIKMAGVERRKAIMADAKLLEKQAKDTGKSFANAYGSLSWNNGENKGFANTFGLGATDLLKPNAGFGSVLPVLGGGGNGGGTGGDGNGGGNGGGTGKATADAIATGGTKSTIVNIEFKNMVEKLTITSSTGKFRESASEMERQVAEALQRVLAMSALHAG